jgi:hypothetical protein
MKKYHFTFNNCNTVSSVEAETLIGALGWIEENTLSSIDDITSMEVI